METGIIIGILVFLIGLAISIPITWVFLSSSIIILLLSKSPLTFMAGTYFHSFDSFVLMAIAFFVFLGTLAGSSGIAQKLIDLSYMIVGKFKGGMEAVGIVTTVFLGALTGSALPTISATIPLLVGPLEKYGYERRYTTAVLCSCCFLGYLIPPSVPVLIYCLFSKQSVAAVFLSTIIPGLMLAGGYLILNRFICDKYKHPTKEESKDFIVPTRKVKIKIFLGALPALGIPLIILVGIYGGICTPNEAGALGLIYTAFVAKFVYRTLDRKNALLATKRAIISVGMIFGLIGFAMIFARVFAREGVIQLFVNSVTAISDNRFVVLMIINIILLILGMFIDDIPILVIAMPLLIPLAENVGVNLVHLGAIMVFNVGVGIITPPYALSIFLGSSLSGVSYSELLKIMLLYLLIVALPVLLLTTYIPALSCWLPSLIMGSEIVGSW